MQCTCAHDCLSLDVAAGSAACLKDIQRFLRNDDAQSRETFFTLGEFDVAKQHLMPLITTYPDNVEVVFNARECISLRTNPPVGICPASGALSRA